MRFIDSEFQKKLKGKLTIFTCIFYLVGSGSVAGSRIWMPGVAGQIRIRFKMDQIHPVQNGLGQPTPSSGEAIYNMEALSINKYKYKTSPGFETRKSCRRVTRGAPGWDCSGSSRSPPSPTGTEPTWSILKYRDILYIFWPLCKILNSRVLLYTS